MRPGKIRVGVVGVIVSRMTFEVARPGRIREAVFITRTVSFLMPVIFLCVI